MRHLIISDIHGRNYWQSVVMLSHSDDKFTFLGDYLDMYPGQKNIDCTAITHRSAIENFKEILSFKKKNPEQVTLLLGNHDLEYFVPKMCPCRKDEKNSDEIKQLFLDNIDLFKIGEMTFVDNIPVSLTHANVTRSWVQECLFNKKLKDLFFASLSKDSNWTDDELIMNFEVSDVVYMLNKLLETKNFEILGECLCQIGRYRGGDDIIGSPVWCDFGEAIKNYWNNTKLETPENTYQIVGHTQHFVEKEGDFYASYNKICLDCHYLKMNNRVAFELVPFYTLNNYYNTCVKIFG